MKTKSSERRTILVPTLAAVLTAAMSPGLAPDMRQATTTGPEATGQSPPEAVEPPKPVDPELASLLERAGEYVLEYEQAFSNIVVEETYWQRVTGSYAGTGLPRRSSRVTRADLVFVRLRGDFPWGSFRDVFEVDGQAVRDRDARLERLFLEAPASAVQRAREILRQSAAYNIGSAIRTLNLPTLPLLFLHPRNQPHFIFERRGRRRIAGVEGVEVRFEEVARPTLVTGQDSADLPARGRFWIHSAHGTILRSEARFRFEPNRAIASVATEYRPEPRLAMWVPAEMKERYEDLPLTSWPVFGVRTEATARYSNVRRFGVTIEEKARLPPP